MSNYEFTLIETDGKDISLSDYRGKNVVVYFYPKDNTPGWNSEANSFKDLYDQFKENNTEILGVSRDSLKSHAKFRDKFQLPFLLLSDEDKKVHEQFNVMVPTKMFGKEGMGVERSTFIFNSEGELVKEYRKVKVDGHAEEVLNFVKDMQ